MDEYIYVRSNFKDLLDKYHGKFIIVKDTRVWGVFNDLIEAYNAGKTTFGNEEFLLQEVSEGAMDEVVKLRSPRFA